MAEGITPKYMDGVDSGWQELTDTTKFSRSIYYRKIGKLVQVIVDGISFVSPVTSSFYAIAALPSGYRPSKLQYASASGDFDYPALMSLSTNGTLGLYLEKNSSIASFFCDVMFFAD